MIAKIDEMYMRRCLQLARLAEGYTSPNPMVGAVIVSPDGRIIGEGWHHCAGQPHAEVNAVNSVDERNLPLLKDSTIYVSLEPCAHYGRTPPCAELLVRCGFRRVVVGCVDSFSQVSGRGIQILRNAGIEVSVGVLESECRALNRRFFCVNELRRPYVILKWAQTADAFIGAISSDGTPAPIRISNHVCQRAEHRRRAVEDAILVGVQTVVSDNPSLTTRHFAGKSPIRIVIDPHLRTPPSATILTDGLPTVIFNSSSTKQIDNVRYEQADFSAPDALQSLLQRCLSLGIQSLIVEGGSLTLQSFIDAGLWDEAYVYMANITVLNGVAAPQMPILPTAVCHVGNCQVSEYQRPTS